MTVAQLDLFASAKSRGQQQALTSTAGSAWSRSAYRWIESLPAGTRFTADDVVLHCDLPNQSDVNANNAVGALFSHANRAGVIARTGQQVPSTRSEAHGRWITVWVKA